MKSSNLIYGKYLKIDYFVEQAEVGDLFALAFGTAKCNNNFAPSKQTKFPFFSLHYVHSGQGTLYRNDREFPVRAGDIFLIYPDEMTRHSHDPKNPWEIFWINFQGKKATSLVERMHFDHESPVLSGDHEEIYKAFTRVLSKKIPSAEKDLISMSLLYELISIVSKIHGKPTKQPPEFPPYISNAMLYIEQNYFNPFLSLNEVARFCNINPNYLSRLFRSSLNICFSHYLSSIRMQKAKELLALKKYKINEVSNLVGYNDPLYFSKEFKKYVGMPPSDYQGNYTKYMKKK